MSGSVANNVPRGADIALILAGCLAMFLIIEFGPGLLVGQGANPVLAAVLASAIMLALAPLLQRLFFHHGPAAALAALGYRRPSWRALSVSLILSGVAALFFPVFAMASGATITLKADWWWILVGVVALNGLAEETLFRGWTFGGLRRAGLGFGRAGAVSLLVFAAVHLLLFVDNPPVVAALGILVAVTMAFPMAYLYERGNNTIWAPAVLHVAAHGIRFVDIDEANYLPAVTAWLCLEAVLPLLVFPLLGTPLRLR